MRVGEAAVRRLCPERRLWGARAAAAADNDDDDDDDDDLSLI